MSRFGALCRGADLLVLNTLGNRCCDRRGHRVCFLFLRYAVASTTVRDIVIDLDNIAGRL